MNQPNKIAIHWSFWLIVLLALIWNLLGAVNYFMQMNPEVLATYPESHRAIVTDRPAWATAGFAISVFGGALGCFLLLARKSVAGNFFIASLAGTLLTLVHSINIAFTVSFTLFEVLLGMLMPIVVAAFLIWYSKRSKKMGWIR